MVGREEVGEAVVATAQVQGRAEIAPASQGQSDIRRDKHVEIQRALVGEIEFKGAVGITGEIRQQRADRELLL